MRQWSALPPSRARAPSGARVASHGVPDPVALPLPELLPTEASGRRATRAEGGDPAATAATARAAGAPRDRRARAMAARPRGGGAVRGGDRASAAGAAGGRRGARGGSRRWRRTSRSMSLGARGEVGPRSGVRGCLEWRRNNVSPVSPVRPRGLRIRAETSPPETLESLRQPEPVRSLLESAVLSCFREKFLPPPRLQTCARHRVAH